MFMEINFWSGRQTYLFHYTENSKAVARAIIILSHAQKYTAEVSVSALQRFVPVLRKQHYNIHFTQSISNLCKEFIHQ